MSAAHAKSPDPSMEEILASIRRIIADDQDGPKPGGAEPDRARAETPAAEDDVLDLAEEAEPAARARPDLNLEAPDVAFQEPDPEPDPEPVPEPESPKAAADPVEVAQEPLAPSPPPLPPPVAEHRPETLISTEATASVGHAFHLLSHTIMSQNAHTLEDLVKEMLRPMLKGWLDDNLPPLVERLVRAEIERVARGGR